MFDWIKHHRKSIIIFVVIIITLSSVFFLTENTPEKIVQNSYTEQSSVIEQTSVEVSKEQKSATIESSNPESSISEEISFAVESSEEETTFMPVSEEVHESEVLQLSQSEQISQKPIQSSIEIIQESSFEEIISKPELITEESFDNSVLEVSESKTKCTLSISCHVLLDNLDKLKKNKISVIPSNGWILTDINTDFDEGESVFDVTKRICMENKIPFEFTMTPVYNVAYIEGINNIYEFDCGSTSGWLYRINGEFLSYSCSDCKLNDGDKIEWIYTCNLGKDVGNG